MALTSHITAASTPGTSPLGRLNTAYDLCFSKDVDENLAALEAIRLLRLDLEQVEDNAAFKARRNGATWEQIGAAVNLTRQRAHQKWGFVDQMTGFPKD